MKSPRNTCPRRPAFLWVCAVPPRRPCPQAAAGQLIPLRLGPHVSCGKIGLVPDPSRPVPKCLPQLIPAVMHKGVSSIPVTEVLLGRGVPCFLESGPEGLSPAAHLGICHRTPPMKCMPVFASTSRIHFPTSCVRFLALVLYVII